MLGVVMPSNKQEKVFRLPRHLLAVIANDNPQAIKALENLELQVGQTLPEQVEVLQKTVEILADELQGAYAVALQALAKATEKQDYLPMVAVCEYQDVMLEPVGVNL